MKLTQGHRAMKGCIRTPDRLACARVGALSLATSKCDPETRTINLTWEFARNAEYQSQFQTYSIRVWFEQGPQVIPLHIKVWEALCQALHYADFNLKDAPWDGVNLSPELQLRGDEG